MSQAKMLFEMYRIKQPDGIGKKSCITNIDEACFIQDKNIHEKSQKDGEVSSQRFPYQNQNRERGERMECARNGQET